MVTKDKELYEAPTTEVVELAIHGIICASQRGIYDPNDYENGGDPLAS